MNGPAHRPPDAASRALRDRIDAGIRERLEEAVDDACLDGLVRARRAANLAPPAADSAADRAEFEASVQAFLHRLRAEVLDAGDVELGRHADETARHAGGDERARLFAVQVMLAKRLPDYWQRFDAIRTAYTEQRAASGGQRPGLFRRILGGG